MGKPDSTSKRFFRRPSTAQRRAAALGRRRSRATLGRAHRQHQQATIPGRIGGLPWALEGPRAIRKCSCAAHELHWAAGGRFFPARERAPGARQRPIPAPEANRAAPEANSPASEENCVVREQRFIVARAEIYGTGGFSICSRAPFCCPATRCLLPRRGVPLLASAAQRLAQDGQGRNPRRFAAAARRYFARPGSTASR